MHHVYQILERTKFHVNELLSMFPELGVITGISAIFIDPKTALQYTGLCIGVLISFVTLLIKLKELKDKYK